MLISVTAQMQKVHGLSKTSHNQNLSPLVDLLSSALKFIVRKRRNNGKTKNFGTAKSKKNRKNKKIL